MLRHRLSEKGMLREFHHIAKPCLFDLVYPVHVPVVIPIAW